jgi:serine/threonine-protein phosphatase 2A regulatory subunit B''
MFFQPVIKKLEQKMGGEYKVDDLKDELWDMAKPALPTAITL